MSKELRINRRCESLAEAREVAKRELHAKNRQTVTGSIAMMGEPLAAAGVNIDVSDAGRLSGKYHVESVTHDYSPGLGYTTTIATRKGAPDVELPGQGKTVTGQTKDVRPYE